MNKFKSILLIGFLALSLVGAAPTIQTASEAVMYRAGYIDAEAQVEQSQIVTDYVPPRSSIYYLPFRTMADISRGLAYTFADYRIAFFYFLGRYEAFSLAADAAGEP